MAEQPLIRNFGLFWRVEDVYWGRGKQRGALYGVHSDRRRSEHVDFRDQRGVYALYADYELVYIGQILNRQLMTRLKEHKKDELAGRWNRFSWYGIRKVIGGAQLGKLVTQAHVALPLVLNHIEGILIHTAEPKLNRQGGKFGEKVDQYLQVRDERLGPSEIEMLRDIHKSLVK